MTTDILSSDKQDMPDLEIKYHGRNILLNPNLTRRRRTYIRRMEFISYFFIIIFLFVVPFIALCIGFLSDIPIDKILFGLYAIYMIFGPFGLLFIGIAYPYRKGYVRIIKNEIQFRSESILPAFFSPMKRLKFPEIKKISITEQDNIVGFQRQNGHYIHLNVIGMAISDWNRMKSRLKQISDVEFV